MTSATALSLVNLAEALADSVVLADQDQEAAIDTAAPGDVTAKLDNLEGDNMTTIQQIHEIRASFLKRRNAAGALRLRMLDLKAKEAALYAERVKIVDVLYERNDLEMSEIDGLLDFVEFVVRDAIETRDYLARAGAELQEVMRKMGWRNEL